MVRRLEQRVERCSSARPGKAIDRDESMRDQRCDRSRGVGMRYVGGTMRGARVGARSERRPADKNPPLHVPLRPKIGRFAAGKSESMVFFWFYASTIVPTTCGACATHTSARPCRLSGGAIASRPKNGACCSSTGATNYGITQVVAAPAFARVQGGREAAANGWSDRRGKFRRAPAAPRSDLPTGAVEVKSEEIEVLGRRASCDAGSASRVSGGHTPSLPLLDLTPRSPARPVIKRGQIIDSIRCRMREGAFRIPDADHDRVVDGRSRATPQCRRADPGKFMRCAARSSSRSSDDRRAYDATSRDRAVLPRRGRARRTDLTDRRLSLSARRRDELFVSGRRLSPRSKR